MMRRHEDFVDPGESHRAGEHSIQHAPMQMAGTWPCSGIIHVVEATSGELVRLFDSLNAEGYRVATFSNPFDALDSVLRSHPDLVIADAHLPDMDGLELTGRIRRASPATRVILTSSRPDQPAYREVIEIGGETLIHKPIESEVLLSAVRRALSNIRHRNG